MTNLGYCPHCKQNVMLTREDLNCCLFLLLLMTAVGWIIYLVIWLARPEDRCVICGNVALPPKPETNNQPSLPAANNRAVLPPPTTSPASGTFMAKNPTTIKSSNTNMPAIKSIKFCPYCGAELPLNASFCAGCGVNLQK